MARQPTTGAEQALYIRQVSERSRASRDALSLTNRTFLNDALSQSSIDIQSEIQSLAGLQTKSSAFQIQRLQVVQKNIDKIADDLQKRFKVFADDAVEGAYQVGVRDSISDLVDLKIPSYVALAADELDDLALAVFSVVDTSALDFLTRFQLQLLGDVTEDVRNGIKMKVASGIATGQSMPDIAREVGKVIIDPEEFRKAGKTIFKDAQTRIDLITRTETNRAHNQGRLKFYEHAGIRRVIWIATLDRRTAPLDESYHGQIFKIDEVPAIPLHPRCRCTIAAHGPTRECEIKPAAEAAISDAQGACVQTPEQIHSDVAEITAKDKKAAADLTIAKQALKSQKYDHLSSSQARLACQQAGISIHRSKADKLLLLDKFEPGIDHSKLVGAQLTDALKKHKIGVLRSKSEMIALLEGFDSAIAAAEKLVLVTIPDFKSMTVIQLQDEAQKIGIVMSKNKKQIIAEMDALVSDPPIPHIMLKGQDYQNAIAKYKISKLKGKQQFIDELTEAYQAAQTFKGVKGATIIAEEAIKTAKLKSVQDEIIKAKKIVDDLIVPTDVIHYKKFLDEYSDAWIALNGIDETLDMTLLAGDFDTWSTLVGNLEAKKAFWNTGLEDFTSTQLKKIAAAAKIDKYQWYNKSETLTKLTSIDEGELATIHASVAQKYHKWYYKHGGGKGKKIIPLPEIPAPPPPKLPHPLSPAAKAKIKKVPYAPKPAAPISEPHPIVPPSPIVKKVPAPKPKAPKIPGAQIIPEIPVPIPDPTKLVSPSAAFTDADEAWDKIKTTSGYFRNKRKAQVGGAHRKYFYDDPDGNTWLFKPTSKGETFRAHGDEAAYKIQRLIDPDAPAVRYIEIEGQAGSIQPMLDNVAKQADFSGISPTALSQIEIEQLQREQVVDWLISNHDGHASNFLRGTNGHVYGIDKGQLFKHLGDDKLAITYYPNAAFDAGEPYYNILMRAWRDGNIEVDLHATLKYIKRAQQIPDNEYLEMLRLYVEGRFKGKSKGQLTAFYNLALERKHNLQIDFEKFYNQLAKTRGLKGFKFVEVPVPVPVPKVPKRRQLSTHERKIVEEADAARWQGKSIPVDVDEIEDQNILIFTQRVKNRPFSYQTVLTFKVRPEHEKKIFKVLRKKPEKGMRISTERIFLQDRRNSKGEIIWNGRKVTMDEVFDYPLPSKGKQYRIYFSDDDVEIIFRPFKGTVNDDFYSLKGDVEIRIPGKASAEVVEKALDKMKRLGINTELATIEDAEILYLQKTAYIRKIHKQPRYLEVIKRNKGKPKSAQVQALRDFWNRELEVADVTKLDDYNPYGVYQSGSSAAKTPKTPNFGRRIQYRFDLSQAQLEKQMPDLALRHTVSQEDISDVIEAALDNNGAMISTMEKFRIGIPPSATSPLQDMETGGSTYFFTRLKKRPTPRRTGLQGLYFKKNIIRRMDAITFDADRYGRVTGTTVARNRWSYTHDWKRIRRSGGGQDETILKYTVTIPDNIDIIVVANTFERKQVIASFKKHGYSKLPDGRKIESVVLVQKYEI